MYCDSTSKSFLGTHGRSIRWHNGQDGAATSPSSLRGRATQVCAFLDKEEDGMVKKQDLIQAFPMGSRVWHDLIAAGWITEERPDPYIRHYSDAGVLAQSVDEAPTRVTMLLEPHGWVHLTTGILPVKALQLPRDQYQQALRRIEVTFLNAPVLTPRRRLKLGLPAEPGYHWSFLQKERPQKGSPVQVSETLQEHRIAEQVFLDQWKALQAATPSPAVVSMSMSLELSQLWS